jgi:U3 small nucleolar RNA-associated protein 7
MQLRETVRDVQFLHNERLFAVAQKSHVYLYDASGSEINFLAKHIDPLRLAFLPYHFLLVSIGNQGFLKYHVSLGDLHGSCPWPGRS